MMVNLWKNSLMYLQILNGFRKSNYETPRQEESILGCCIKSGCCDLARIIEWIIQKQKLKKEPEM